MNFMPSMWPEGYIDLPGNPKSIFLKRKFMQPYSVIVVAKWQPKIESWHAYASTVTAGVSAGGSSASASAGASAGASSGSSTGLDPTASLEGDWASAVRHRENASRVTACFCSCSDLCSIAYFCHRLNRWARGSIMFASSAFHARCASAVAPVMKIPIATHMVYDLCI